MASIERSSGKGVSRYKALLRELNLAMTLEDVRSAYLVAVGHVISAEGIGFYRLSDTSDAPPLEIAANLGSDFLSRYEAFGRPDDPVLKHVLRHRLPVDSGRLPRDEWERSGAREVLALADLSHSMQAPVVKAGEIVGTINFARGGPRPFSEKELSTARTLAQHVGLALERAHRFEEMETRALVLEGAFDRSSGAVVICRPSGEPVFVTKYAGELLGPSFPADEQGVAGRVRRAIQDFADGGDFARTTQVADPLEDRRLILKLHRLRRRDALVCFLYSDSHTARTALPAVEVLSRREQEIAAMVARGLSTKDMAAEAFISENTIKQHLKRIFAKVSVTSRAELVQLVWSLHESGPNHQADR
ncbi:LuxR C-terminal-related transcriptional regulator [Microbacterium sp. LMC-P-041]|uniref:LuxR C-terminal-related transcriptional regulator n=1 Tax=Microbacterium sp. LMC-P-041 TaxID=3040293 RepID=UPI002554C190|nr:LuxR C-terminal-related transcriptional regulator [Microbacterium sp. LMC-P-041]